MVIFKYSLNVTTCDLITVRTNHKKQEATKRHAGFLSTVRKHQTYKNRKKINVYKTKHKRRNANDQINIIYLRIMENISDLWSVKN